LGCNSERLSWRDTSASWCVSNAIHPSVAEQIKVGTIAEEAEYQGVRIWFPAKIDTMSLNMKIDIGFGDVVYPAPEKLKSPPCQNSPHHGCCVTAARV